MDQSLRLLETKAEQFLRLHATGQTTVEYGKRPITGEFSVYRGTDQYDLFGMIDAVYTLTTLGVLADRTDAESRNIWAQRILSCQDEVGWFSKRNLHHHSVEHTTAYALGALELLQLTDQEDYLSGVRPIQFLRALLTNKRRFNRWMYWMGFEISRRGVSEKRLGWQYIWRGSHIGGGVAAIIGTMRHYLAEWWGPTIDADRWFDWYFDWLAARISPSSGFWQRGLHNLFIKRPTLIDMAGAVHFFWIYDAAQKPFPHPEAVITSTLPLQRDTGLYRDHPFCIDYDANFCLVRSFLQLSAGQQAQHRPAVEQALKRNFEGIVDFLTAQLLAEIYTDTHGLPGALAALIECAKFPDFHYTGDMAHWQHPMDRTWWL